MADFTIYTKENCSFCNRAKEMLQKQGLSYDEVVIPRDTNREHLQERVHQAGSTREIKTVPQIFHGERYVGDFNNLVRYLSQ